MIGLSSTVRVMLATRPVDFRKGMDGLAALGRDAMGADPFSGTVYVFRSKRADRVKLLVWDGSGLVLAVKRLEAGQFCWPKIEDGVVRLSAAQLAALVGSSGARTVVHCPPTCRGSSASSTSPAPLARAARVPCTGSARTSLSVSTWCRLKYGCW